MALPKLLQSSSNPESLALSLKAGVPFVILLLPLFGVVNIAEGDLVELINALAVAATGMLTLYGVGRKLFLKFKK